MFDPVVAFDPVLITSLGHPLSKLRKVSLRDISRYPLILPPRHLSTWRQVEMVFQQHRLPYEVRLEMGGWEVIKRYVELPLGINRHERLPDRTRAPGSDLGKEILSQTSLRNRPA